MMRIILLATAVGVAASATPSVAAEQSVVGRWNTGSRGGVVEIHRCGKYLCGRVVDGDPLRANPDQRDVNNGDPALRNRRVMNLRVLENFEADGARWAGGPLYDPNNGDRASSGYLTLADPDTLKVKGCIAPLLCRTKTWTRQR